MTLANSAATSFLFFVSLLVLPTFTAAFASIHHDAQRHRRLISHYYSTPKHSPLEDEPWEKDDSYWDMLQAASKDPKTFEKFIDESMARRTKKSSSSGSGQEGRHDRISSSSEQNKEGVNGNNDVDGKTMKKYVPIEEWEEQRKNGENMSWEERLQWESQRGGDQFRQNEILRQNLKQF
jgi:hypothetical protein